MWLNIVNIVQKLKLLKVKKSAHAGLEPMLHGS